MRPSKPNHDEQNICAKTKWKFPLAKKLRIWFERRSVNIFAAHAKRSLFCTFLWNFSTKKRYGNIFRVTKSILLCRKINNGFVLGKIISFRFCAGTILFNWMNSYPVCAQIFGSMRFCSEDYMLYYNLTISYL